LTKDDSEKEQAPEFNSAASPNNNRTGLCLKWGGKDRTGKTLVEKNKAGKKYTKGKQWVEWEGNFAKKEAQPFVMLSAKNRVKKTLHPKGGKKTTYGASEI